MHKQINHSIVLLLLSIAIISCNTSEQEQVGENSVDSFPANQRKQTVQSVEESHQTKRTEADNIDSPAFWLAPDGKGWIIATAKEANQLVIYDASSGEEIQRFGKGGSDAGEFLRPNGIAVVENLVFVVERDNRRVQILELPSFTTLGFCGESELVNPYGLSVLGEGDGQYKLYVTDNYETPEETIPPDSTLNERVHLYQLTRKDKEIHGELLKKFGDTTKDGALRIVESIATDEKFGRLLIAEEDERNTHVKVYDLNGAYEGKTIGEGKFTGQVEGIALYHCGDSAGYWIITDQSMTENTFHVFDRATLNHIGAFQGPETENTDGIALTRQEFRGFPMGAFFAVDDDGGVSTFSWENIGESFPASFDCSR